MSIWALAPQFASGGTELEWSSSRRTAVSRSPGYFSRAKVIEAGWSEDDIDRLINQAQKEVELLLPG